MEGDRGWHGLSGQHGAEVRGTWGAWFRDNSDKYLVALIMAGLLGYNLHIMHHVPDQGQLQFVDALINNLQGAFLTLVTGAILRKSSSATAANRDPQTGATTNVTTIQEEEK